VIRPVAIPAAILLYSEIKTVQKLVSLIRPIVILAMQFEQLTISLKK
jgi:hypothetical protein